jgi:DNA primase
LFNTRFLSGQRKYVFLVEGPFDALVIDGVAALGASLNERQIAWIAASDMQPIVVPDRDFAGNRLIDIAITQNWPVAFPHYGRHQWWEADIKDVDDAVRRYGKLYVMQSLLATAEVDHRKIQQRAKYRL